MTKTSSRTQKRIIDKTLSGTRFLSSALVCAASVAQAVSTEASVSIVAICVPPASANLAVSVRTRTSLNRDSFSYKPFSVTKVAVPVDHITALCTRT